MSIIENIKNLFSPKDRFKVKLEPLNELTIQNISVPEGKNDDPLTKLKNIKTKLLKNDQFLIKTLREAGISDQDDQDAYYDQEKVFKKYIKCGVSRDGLREKFVSDFNQKIVEPWNENFMKQDKKDVEEWFKILQEKRE